MGTPKRVLSVGQCSADQWSIERALTGHFAVEVISVSTFAEARQQLHEQRFDLLLVNRISDADGSRGLDLIKQVRAAPGVRMPVMLVSNMAGAQAEARSAGAVPGFGKEALGQESMLAALRPFLDSNRPLASEGATPDITRP